MIKAVIFDIDGVLLNSFESNLRFFQAVFTEAGYTKQFTASWYRQHYHFTMPETIAKFVGDVSSEEYNRLLSIAKRLYLKKRQYKSIPYAVSTIKKLSKQYKLGIATGRLKEGLDGYLHATNTKEYFKSVAYLGKYTHPKPHAEPLLMVCKGLRVKPEEVVFIGDSIVDVGAAHAAGTKFIFFNTKRIPGVTVMTHDMRQIPKLIATFSK